LYKMFYYFLIIFYSLLTSWEVTSAGWGQSININNNDTDKIQAILQVVIINLKGFSYSLTCLSLDFCSIFIVQTC